MQLVREAGELARHYYDAWHGGPAASALAVELKEGGEPVTAADRAVSELCIQRLRAAFPGDAILSEEVPDDGARHQAARTWLIDPIDGTKDFIVGRPGFSVMIGLLAGGRPTLGAVYQPTADRLWYASAGGGAYLVTGGAPPRRLHVADSSDLSQARLVSSASHPDPLVTELRTRAGIRDEQNIGSVGIKLGLVAAGERDLYVNPASKCKLWDTAAPEIILAEAGGRLTDLVGEPLSYTREDLGHRRGLVASNGRLHAAALAQLEPIVRALRPQMALP
ncbi:MAG: 3'(2'),5'-bisphosphate nucleotidase CysQ [Pseudoxanthomonas sp.]